MLADRVSSTRCVALLVMYRAVDFCRRICSRENRQREWYNVIFAVIYMITVGLLLGSRAGRTVVTHWHMYTGTDRGLVTEVTCGRQAIM